MHAITIDERPFLLFDLPQGQRSLRGLWLLVGYYLFSLVFGAVMAAPSYWFVEWIASIWPSQLTDYLLGKTLDNYFERMRMVPLLLGLPWIMWMCRLLSLRALGLGFSWKYFREACLWFCFGMATLGLVALGQWAAGATVAIDPAPSIIGTFLKALSGAVAVALIEEIVFRGIVLRIFFSAFGAFWAVVLSSAFYAYTHFKIPSVLVSTVAGDTDFLTGFNVGFWTLFGIVKGFSFIEFTVLFLLGCAIGQLFLKTRTLLPCIGLHSGLVFTMIFYHSFFRTPPPESVFWGNVGFKTSYASLIVLIILNTALWIYRRRAAVAEGSGNKS